MVLFTYLIHGPFGQFLTQNYVCFFKYSLNFQGHAQKFELNKVWHANFIEFEHSCFSRSVKCSATTMEIGFQVTILDSEALES